MRLHPSEPGPRETERPRWVAGDRAARDGAATAAGWRQGRERRSDGVSCITFLYHERRSERQATTGGCILRRKTGKTPPVGGVSCIVEVVVSSVVVVVGLSEEMIVSLD
ncbi:hypothetical protein ACFE04_020001 [Oxalis oulophora]